MSKISVTRDFIERLDKRDPAVLTAYEAFEELYSNSFNRTTVSKIIDGENIKVALDNIRIDEPVDTELVPVDKIDELFSIFCTKKPYEYQRQAILKILEMEHKQKHIDPVTGKTIVSNGYQLALPIGSGKSLIFEFLALFFKKVPIHPIIVSTDGRFVPQFEQLQFEQYPFYYENCAYVEEDANAVMAIETEIQRECTVILTYTHLIPQLKSYFAEDFTKQILSQRKIIYFDYRELRSDKIPKDADIIIVVAEEQNVNRLIEMSYEMPFARVVVDDYTNMNDLARMRQILTFSFIPVSGSGFERALNTVPSSYYSLKNTPYEQIKLVGDPVKTYEGVMRSNIMTGELLTSKSEFDVYQFVSSIENAVRRLPNCQNEMPSTLFKEFEESQPMELYLKYGFFIKNADNFRKMTPSLIMDIETGKADKSKASFFIEWYNNTPDKKFRDILCSPLYGEILETVPTLLSAKCAICGRGNEDTNGFGVISSCCGAFICYNCIDEAATHDIVNPYTIEKMVSDDYYCVCCRAKNCRYYFNSTRHSTGRDIRSYIFADKYFEADDVEGHYSIDYYFKMIQNGWKLRKDKCNGRSISIARDISKGIISKDVFKQGIIPDIERIRSSDIIFPQVLTAIYSAYIKTGLKPVDNSILLVYKCKDNLQSRMIERFNELKALPDSPFAKTYLQFRDTVGSVIGLSMNIIGIVIYSSEEEEFFSMIQLIGRLLRISSYGQKILFYINNNNQAYETVDYESK